MTIDQENSRRKVWRHSDLLAIGLSRREIRRQLDDGRLAHPCLPGCEPEQGIYVANEAVDHPDLTESVVGILTGGGVFCRQFAAWRHGLTTAFPDRIEIYVPAASTVRTRSIYSAVRTRNDKIMTLGVQSSVNDLGIEIRITSPARTVLDLLRAMRRDGDDWRHGVEAMRAFVAAGQDTAELADLSTQFESWLPEIVDAIGEGFNAGPSFA